MTGTSEKSAFWQTRPIAEMVCATDLERYSADAKARGRDGILDYLAVTYAGSVDPLVDAMRDERRLCPDGGRATIIGRKGSAGWLDAAAIDGFSSHVLDFDDMLPRMRGHPSGPVLSALFPLAEEIGASGHAVLQAYMVALEGIALAGRQVAVPIQEAGLHSTAVLGAFGAALACSKLLALSPDQVCSSAALAIAQTGGSIANFGTPSKAMQVGLAAAAGGRAAMLASVGVSGPDAAIEDLWARYGRDFDSAASSTTLPIPSIWEQGELQLKRYASCSLTHQTIEGAKQLRLRRNGREVVGARILGSYRIARMLHYPVPENRFETKFSLPYCFAVAYLFDEPLLNHLTVAEVDPLVIDLARRVTFEIHPELADYRTIGKEFIALEVAYADGGADEIRVSEFIQLADRNELIAKAHACFSEDADSNRADEVIRLVEGIEQLSSMERLMAALSRPR